MNIKDCVFEIQKLGPYEPRHSTIYWELYTYLVRWLRGMMKVNQYDSHALTIILMLP